MANYDDTIFIDPTTTPRTGVSIGDLQTVLQSSYKDIGNLIVNTNINKWAKYKPFRSSYIGFTLDPTQSTPDLRSPQRLAQALAANYGLTIPRYTVTNYKSNYSDQWTYNRPRGLQGTTLNPTNTDEWFRLLDFDGYLHNCYWQLSPVGNHGIYTIFDGYFGVPGATVFAGDTVQFSIRCCEDPDTGLPGLLYPYDFLRDQQHDYDLSKYYMGIALLDSSNVLWVITGDRMDTHHTLYDVDASMTAAIPNNAANGAMKAMPILADTQSPLDSGTQLRTWTNAHTGYIVGLDGAYLSLTKASSSNMLQISVTVTYNNPGVTLSFSIHNQTANSVELSNLYGFIMSGDSYMNECGSGHNVPSYVGTGVTGFIETEWPTARQSNPADFGLSNPPDIYMYDWDNSYPLYLAARGYNANVDFRAANNNTGVIAAGATITWTKTFNNISEDDFGYYNDDPGEGVYFALCVNVAPAVSYVEYFSTWD